MSKSNETSNISFSILTPTSVDIQIAGWALVIPSIASLIFYCLCMKAMWQLKDQYRLFGFLISFGICDIGIILISFYFGVSLLRQYTIIDGWMVLAICDFLWHPLIYHYSLLAASRFVGIVWPLYVNTWLTQQRIAMICGVVWVISMLQFVVILL